mmetsp:Transcript_41924/g.67994  ORF Transcript_41924/g.67994 Transcript_41924/m.67994 type:complete len:91 (+) Transcript_41924:715-987(+)
MHRSVLLLLLCMFWPPFAAKPFLSLFQHFCFGRNRFLLLPSSTIASTLQPCSPHTSLHILAIYVLCIEYLLATGFSSSAVDHHAKPPPLS